MVHECPAVEANNVIIGRTWLDADQARAGDALGLSTADRLKLRDLRPSEFYALGPALGQPGVVRFRSDLVRTTHIRGPANVICSRRRRERFAECWASLPTCHTKRKGKSEASMRRVPGSLSLSVESKASRALVQLRRSTV